MSWINLALLGTFAMSVVNILDSHLISKRVPSLRVYLLLTGTTALIYGLVLFSMFPLPGGVSLTMLLMAIASGISRVVGIVIMLYILKREEVSRVIPVVYAYPIFVAIMAVPLLGDSLYYLEWLAVIIVVAGAIMISIRRSPSGGTSRLGKSFLFLSGSSLLIALGDIFSKYVLSYMSFLNLLWLVNFCFVAVCFLISLRPHTFKQLSGMKQKHSVIGLMIFSGSLAPVAMMLLLWAIQEGRVYLVSTISASRPIFVLIFAFILSRAMPAFLEWQYGKETLVLRIVATCMVVGGIIIIYLI